MTTLKCVLLLALTSQFLVSIACGQDRTQLAPPNPIVESIEGVLKTNADQSVPKVAVVVRIPATIITKALNRDFDNKEIVQREVLGTHSQGVATCRGTVTGMIEENPNGATFCCRIQGTVHSATCGTNGPAIIHSQAKTSYVAYKSFSFNGKSFVSVPTSVTLNTNLHITGIDSTLPALRGRIVRRVASKRAVESHAQAEAITAQLTHQELTDRIDSEFDTRLSDLNRKLASRLSVIEHFQSTGNQIFIRSFNDSVEIGLVTPPLTRNDVAIHQVPVSESVELWIGKGIVNQTNQVPLTDIPAFSSLLSQVPQWLSTYFSNIPQLAKLDDKTLKIKRYDDWVMIQLLD